MVTKFSHDGHRGPFIVDHTKMYLSMFMLRCILSFVMLRFHTGHFLYRRSSDLVRRRVINGLQCSSLVFHAWLDENTCKETVTSHYEKVVKSVVKLVYVSALFVLADCGA